MIMACLAVGGIACTSLAFGACRHTSRSGMLINMDIDSSGQDVGSSFGALGQLQRLRQSVIGGAPRSAREYHALHHTDEQDMELRLDGDPRLPLE